jgi:hypothetical protein
MKISLELLYFIKPLIPLRVRSTLQHIKDNKVARGMSLPTVRIFPEPDAGLRKTFIESVKIPVDT